MSELVPIQAVAVSVQKEWHLWVISRTLFGSSQFLCVCVCFEDCSVELLCSACPYRDPCYNLTGIVRVVRGMVVKR